MCGRFARTVPIQRIIKLYEIEQNLVEDIEQSSNIFPGEEIAAIVVDEQGKRSLVKFKWNFIPSWVKEPKKGQINARAETANQKPYFRESSQKRRTLIVTDGFYEWDKKGKERVSIYIRIKSGEPFVMAGVYDFRTSK
jgi:putative SOS response-associated peptidase YedK